MKYLQVKRIVPPRWMTLWNEYAEFYARFHGCSCTTVAKFCAPKIQLNKEIWHFAAKKTSLVELPDDSCPCLECLDIMVSYSSIPCNASRKNLPLQASTSYSPRWWLQPLRKRFVKISPVFWGWNQQKQVAKQNPWDQQIPGHPLWKNIQPWKARLKRKLHSATKPQHFPRCFHVWFPVGQPLCASWQARDPHFSGANPTMPQSCRLHLGQYDLGQRKI